MEHPSLQITEKTSPIEKTLRQKLIEVAETAVREYLQTQTNRLSEIDSDLLAKLEEISVKLDLKNSNLELEKQALTTLIAELNK